ncbi:hypothetical protein COLO4_31359 [Corchorus olitorius]|uniref:Endonuclease/exonuclease/phosphatase n=1 Tax=Corchorus olitorius TaxID=93759 RepID=A0A1R3H4K2_9ROSI|nr:hypothetical protein COLO4_31359 [Corchorus olitorius]
MSSRNLKLPHKSTLSEMMRGFIALIESQFQITYFSMGIWSSRELRADPSLMNMIRIIIKVVQDYAECGRDGSRLLLLWLRLVGYLDINSIDLPSLLNNNMIVKQAYMVTTMPTALASIYASFSINDGDSSTLHRLTILLHASQEETAPQNMMPVRVLVLNAGGIQNPDFPRVFYELCEQHYPQFVLVTETRLGGPQARRQRLSMPFPATSSLEPIGHFGGLWLLWNTTTFRCQLTYRTDTSLAAQLTL